LLYDQDFTTEYTAGKLHTIRMQSKDSFGKNLENANDNYQVRFSNKDGSLDGELYVTAVHEGQG
jgi:hypothetical protein